MRTLVVALMPLPLCQPSHLSGCSRVVGTLYTSGTVAGGTNDHPGTIFGVNYIVGGVLGCFVWHSSAAHRHKRSYRAGTATGVKVSQLRAQKQDCPNLYGMSSRRPVECFGDMSSKGAWSSSVEETAPFGKNGVTFTWSGTEGDNDPG